VEEKELSDSGMLVWGNLNDSYAQASMGYPSRWDFSNGIYTVRGWTKPHLVTYMESHDEERITYKNIKYGNSSGSYNVKDTATALKRMELNAAFMLTIPGPKMLWEFGETGYYYSRCYLSTNGEGGDCNTKLDPKPSGWDYLQNIQRKRLHNVYAELIKLRFHPLYKDVFITNQITRNLANGFKWLQITTDTSRICVVGNFDVVSQTDNVTFQTAGTWYDYLEGTTFAATGNSQSMTLQPGEYHVYLNRNVVSNVTTAVPVNNRPVTDLFLKVYSNPVFQNATIDITVPETGNVGIDLLNMTGQKLENIYSGFLSKGTHMINFNNDKNLPAGIYIIKLDTKTGSGAIKIVLK